ncbi:glycosyltransferase [Paenibacillus thiaminolyticus]|uniref:glycosyltransferase n=1 Tax=Paenibacillus thiaminolyticus TaxID=49283 RepID=UPI003D2B473B
MKDVINLDITFPVLNEEKRIEKGVVNTIEFLNANSIHNYVITIADNGSQDGTELISKKLIKKYGERIRYIKLNQRGVGLALISSWRNSDKNIVGYMDIDLSTDITHLTEVLDLFRAPGTDIVNGSRLSKGAQVKNRKLLREVSSRTYNFLLRKIFAGRLRDYTCGFKFFKREVAIDLLDRYDLENGWFFVSQILIYAEKGDYSITELPVRWEDEPDGSTINVKKLTVYYLKEMLKLKKKLNSISRKG